MKIEFKSNYGAFAYRMTAEIGEDVNPATVALALQGLANICYRTVGSNVDKALGVKSKKNGGDGRMAVLYSPADAERINTAVSAKLVEIEAENGGALKPLAMSFAVIGEHVFGESQKPSKEAEALWTSIQSIKDEAVFAQSLAKLGLTEDTADDEHGIPACHKLLLERDRAAKAAARAKTMAELGL